ncbi:hypothetical protein D3C86_1175100 [compost metagenome]
MSQGIRFSLSSFQTNHNEHKITGTRTGLAVYEHRSGAKLVFVRAGCRKGAEF